MDQVHVIRHKVLVEGQSRRSVARELGISRNTVRKYLEQAEPERREGARARPVFEAVKGRIDELLEQWSPRTTAKQRITGSRVHQQLIEEGYEVGVTTVRQYLRELRRQAQEVFIPLVYTPGECAQVDFFEVTVDVDGVRRKAWKFVVRLMYSGRDFAWLYDRCDQVAFLDGHVRAFAHFGGVPLRMIYDNLTAAVKRRVGLERELTDRFLALSSHYLFEACFARPGEGHDKGGVEARGKGIRLQHLTPIPEGQSLDELSARLVEDLDASMDRRQNAEKVTVAARWAEEAGHLRPLPETPFEARKPVPVSVSRQAMVTVEGCRFSVPSRWKSLQATAYVGPRDVRLVCGGEEVLREIPLRKGRVVHYRDYVPELAKKPQAVRQVAPRLLDELGEPFGRLWELLSDRYDEREAARLLSRLLGVMVEEGEQTVADLIHSALEDGTAERLVQRGPEAEPRRSRRCAVPDGLSQFQVESARAADYDELLLSEVA